MSATLPLAGQRRNRTFSKGQCAAFELPKTELLDTLSNMSKKVTAREFLHGFADIQKDLRPGESVTITRHGQAVGEFTKKQTAPKIKMPDFKKDASRPGLDVKAGDRLLARLLRDEAIS
jgi:hypothetical protein